MKLSTVASQTLCGAAAVSALTLPSDVAKRANETGSLPLEHFGWFDTISLDDAKSGVVKSHNGSIHKIVEDLSDSLANIASTIADALKVVPGKASSASITDVADANVDTVSTLAAVTCSNPNVRFEWRDYSDTDRHAFVAAFQCLMAAPSSGNFPPATNRYEDLVRVHQMMTSTIHGNGIFLFWHRYYVWTLEQIMRDECGFDRAFPWWDETLDAGNFGGSSIFSSDFFGTLPAATNGQGTCVTDGVSIESLHGAMRTPLTIFNRALPTPCATLGPARAAQITVSPAPWTSR